MVVRVTRLERRFHLAHAKMRTSAPRRPQEPPSATLRAPCKHPQTPDAKDAPGRKGPLHWIKKDTFLWSVAKLRRAGVFWVDVRGFLRSEPCNLTTLGSSLC